MNNKGFTLIELLAVIVILVSISLVVVSSMSASLQRRDKKECDEQIELAINAAKIYFSLSDCTVKSSDDLCDVTISTLKENKYFNENSKTNRLQDDDSISFTIDGYIFNGTGECTQS